MKYFFLIFTYKTKKQMYFAGIRNGMPRIVHDFKKALFYKSQKALEDSLAKYMFHDTKPLLNKSSEIRTVEVPNK